MSLADVAAAVAALRTGDAVIIPTDTVYGLAASPFVPGAVNALFRIKGRPRDKPLPVLAASLLQLEAVAVLNEEARALAAAFWPGPLTLVVPRAPAFTSDLGEGGGTVAVRVPADDVAVGLMVEAGPLAVTSANRTGEPPATSAAAARAAVGDDVAVVVDRGPREGAASTVVSLVGDRVVLRPGPISEARLRRALARR